MASSRRKNVSNPEHNKRNKTDAGEMEASKDKEVSKTPTSHTWCDPKTQVIFEVTNINDAHFETIVKTVDDDEKINFDTIKRQKLENTNTYIAEFPDLRKLTREQISSK